MIAVPLPTRLSSAVTGPVVLAGGLHLVLLVMADPPPLTIENWDAWASLLQQLPAVPHQ